MLPVMMLLVCRCYWWPLQPPTTTTTTDGEGYQMGVNTSNMDPEVLKYTDRRIEYSVLKTPVRAKDTAHPDDPATY